MNSCVLIFSSNSLNSPIIDHFVQYGYTLTRGYLEFCNNALKWLEKNYLHVAWAKTRPIRNLVNMYFSFPYCAPKKYLCLFLQWYFKKVRP